MKIHNPIRWISDKIYRYKCYKIFKKLEVDPETRERLINTLSSIHKGEPFEVAHGFTAEYWDKLKKTLSEEEIEEVISSGLVKVSLNLTKNFLALPEQKEEKIIEEFYEEILTEKTTLKTIGLNLMPSEHLTIFALQKLLDKTNYKGQGSIEVTYKNNNRTFTAPLLAFTMDQYLEACNVSKLKTKTGATKGYNPKEKKRQLKAFHTLDGKKFPLVTYTKGREVLKWYTFLYIIRAQGLYWKDIDEEEQKRILSHDIPEDYDKGVFVVEVGSSFVIDTKDYFGLRDPDFYTKIKELKPYALRSNYIINFMEWIDFQRMLRYRKENLKKKDPRRYPDPVDWNISINYMKLARQIRLDSLIEENKYKEIRKKLNDCYSVAKEMNYIIGEIRKNVRSKNGLVDKFQLNPKLIKKPLQLTK